MRERNATNKKFDEYTYCVTGLAIRARGLATSLPLSSSPHVSRRNIWNTACIAERGAHLCTFAQKIWGESADLNNRGRNTLKIPSSWHHGASRRFRWIYTPGEEGGQLLRKMDKEKDGVGERESERGKSERNEREKERERRMLVNVAGVGVDLRS